MCNDHIFENDILGCLSRLVNSVEITENSVKFSNLKNSVKFSTESFSKSLKPLKPLKVLKYNFQIFNLTSERWGNTPEIVSKLQFFEENKLEFWETDGYGWVEGEVSGIFWEISENMGEISQKFPETGPN